MPVFLVTFGEGMKLKVAIDFYFKRNSLSCGDFSEAGLSYWRYYTS